MPTGRKLVSTRPIFKLKKDKHNKPIKYKTRFVVKCLLQVQGLNYIKISASINIPPTWRILLAIITAQNWEIKQIDFIGAF